MDLLLIGQRRCLLTFLLITNDQRNPLDSTRAECDTDQHNTGQHLFYNGTSYPFKSHRIRTIRAQCLGSKSGMDTTAGCCRSLNGRGGAGHVNHILLLWFSPSRGLGPFQSSLIESVKRVKEGFN